MTVDVAIIGGGAAGLAAGIEAGRRGLGTLIIERNNELGKKILRQVTEDAIFLMRM